MGVKSLMSASKEPLKTYLQTLITLQYLLSAVVICTFVDNNAQQINSFRLLTDIHVFGHRIVNDYTSAMVK